MRYYALVLAALSLECAIAQPAHHRHHHKARRDLKDVDWKKVDYKVDWNTINYGNGPATATTSVVAAGPTPVSDAAPVDPAPKAAAKKAPKVINVIPVPATSNEQTESKPDTEHFSEKSKSSDAHSNSSKESQSSDDHPSGSSSGGATGGAQGSFGGRTPGALGATVDGYKGNVGVPYGSNMMFISTNDVSNYKYTNTFKNTGSNPLDIIVWNKGGRDGAPQSGMCEEPNLKFTVQSGESQAVAFDENTLASFSRDCKRDSYSKIPMCVWGEVTFGGEMPASGQSGASNKWSGFDRSSIPAGANEVLTMTCTSCDNQDTTSGRGKNAWERPDQAPGKNGVPPGPVHLLTEMAY
ncbi:MAG: hypothetical protein L6R40_004788 [Gallowayella cf. fulva]|nr:MAG: hypothetical protein L6R40_004788 [Xanthomendoza cf. fulva]